MLSGCQLGEFKKVSIEASTDNNLQTFFYENFFSYGIFSFGLIFLVEGRGILQATLTLNGMVGGILLGLFSLGIFFKRANIKVTMNEVKNHKKIA